MDEGSAAKWAGGVDEDFSAAAEEAAVSGARIRTDLFKSFSPPP